MGYTRAQVVESKRVRADQLDELLRVLGRRDICCTIKDFQPASWHDVQSGERKIDWDLFVAEFDKPLRMNPSNQEQLFDLFGEDSDEWVGRLVCLSTSKGTYGNKAYTAIDVSAAPSGMRPTLQPNTNAVALLSEAKSAGVARLAAEQHESSKQLEAKDRQPMGFEVAARCLLRLRERGRTWSDFLKYMRQLNDGRADGCEVHEAPMGVFDEVKRFCAAIPVVDGSEAVTDAAVLKLADELRARAEPPASGSGRTTVDGAVVDTATGEVVGGPPAIDDDIPF